MSFGFMISLRNILVTSVFFLEDLARIIAVDLGNRLLDFFTYLEETPKVGKVIQQTPLLKRIEDNIEHRVSRIIMHQTMSDRRKIFFGSDPFK